MVTLTDSGGAAGIRPTPTGRVPRKETGQSDRLHPPCPGDVSGGSVAGRGAGESAVA